MPQRSVVVLLGLFLASQAAGGSAPAAQRGLTKQQYIAAMTRALDQIAARSAPKTRARLAANLFFAHEAFVERMPVEVLDKVVDAFAEAGVHRVDLNIGLFPWVDRDPAVIQKYDAIVQRIRSKGMRIALNPQYSPVRHQAHGLGEWRRAAMPVISEVAARYRPDVVVVVHEPTTMDGRMRSKSSPAEWREFARDAARAVKESSPGSRAGAGGLPQESAYLEQFADLPEIDVLTLDVYRLVGLEQCNAIVKRAHARGKPVYIEETWRPPYHAGTTGGSLDEVAARSVGDHDLEQLDIKWMNTMADYAAALELEAFTPVWMQTFFKYVDRDAGALDPDYNREVIEAVLRGERTDTYRALRTLGERSR